MGTEAEYLIDREMFGDDDFYPSLTRKQIKDELKRKLTPAEKKIASIRKEIALLVKQGVTITEARKQINLKYGKGWRERGLVSNSSDQWSEEELKPFTKNK